MIADLLKSEGFVAYLVSQAKTKDSKILLNPALKDTTVWFNADVFTDQRIIPSLGGYRTYCEALAAKFADSRYSSYISSYVPCLNADYLHLFYKDKSSADTAKFLTVLARHWLVGNDAVVSLSCKLGYVKELSHSVSKGDLKITNETAKSLLLVCETLTARLSVFGQSVVFEFCANVFEALYAQGKLSLVDFVAACGRRAKLDSIKNEDLVFSNLVCTPALGFFSGKKWFKQFLTQEIEAHSKDSTESSGASVPFNVFSDFVELLCLSLKQAWFKQDPEYLVQVTNFISAFVDHKDVAQFKLPILGAILAAAHYPSQALAHLVTSYASKFGDSFLTQNSDLTNNGNFLQACAPGKYMERIRANPLSFLGDFIHWPEELKSIEFITQVVASQKKNVQSYRDYSYYWLAPLIVQENLALSVGIDEAWLRSNYGVLTFDMLGPSSKFEVADFKEYADITGDYTLNNLPEKLVSKMFGSFVSISEAYTAGLMVNVKYLYVALREKTQISGLTQKDLFDVILFNNKTHPQHNRRLNMERYFFDKAKDGLISAIKQFTKQSEQQAVEWFKSKIQGTSLPQKVVLRYKLSISLIEGTLKSEQAFDAILDSAKLIKGWYDARDYMSDYQRWVIFHKNKFKLELTGPDLLDPRPPVGVCDVLSPGEKGFSFKAYEDLCAWAEIPPYTPLGNGADQRAAITMIKLFGQDTDKSTRFITVAYPSEMRESKSKALHKAGLIRLPEEEYDRTFWGAFLAANPVIKDLMQYCAIYESKFGKPQSIKEFNTNIGAFAYENIPPEHLDFASICHKLKVSQHEFDRMVRMIPSPKKEAYIPFITTSIDGYSIRQLEVKDKRALIIGLESDCCQHLLSAGAKAAIHSYEKASSGVFVIEKNGELVAQAWTWLGTNKKDIVFDSIESARQDAKSIETVSMLFLKLTDIFALKGYDCYLSATSYGMTRDVRMWYENSLKTEKLKNMTLISMHRQSSFLTSSDGVPEIMEPCSYMDAHAGLYNMKPLLGLSALKQPLEALI